MESPVVEEPRLAHTSEPLREIQHVPLWVKGIVACGVILFLIQMPDFMSSLSDATQKSRASAAYSQGRYPQAIEQYRELHTRYPADKELIKQLGFAYYRAGQYLESLTTFDQLAGVKMSKNDVAEINAVISDMAAKLNLNTK